jgi:hypothetical protein
MDILGIFSNLQFFRMRAQCGRRFALKSQVEIDVPRDHHEAVCHS